MTKIIPLKKRYLELIRNDIIDHGLHDAVDVFDYTSLSIILISQCLYDSPSRSIGDIAALASAIKSTMGGDESEIIDALSGLVLTENYGRLEGIFDNVFGELSDYERYNSMVSPSGDMFMIKYKSE